MQFVLILVVVAALVISESSPTEPVSNAGVRALMAMLSVAVVAGFAAVSSGVIAWRVQRDFGQRRTALRTFRTVRHLHALLWLAGAAGTAVWLEWARLVRFNWGLDGTFLLDDLLILLPIILPLVLSWAAFYEVERAVRRGLERSGRVSAPHIGRLEYLTVHLRHYLGLLLAPLLILFVVQDTAELIRPGIFETRYAAVVYVPPTLLLFLFFPLMLRYVWRTRPLEKGPLRSRLEATAARTGLKVREILVWNTGGMAVNAAVAGFVAPLRYVFLTDGLLAQLNDDEIESVLAHEAGHVRRRHLSLRVAAMAVPLSLCLLAEQISPDCLSRWNEWLAAQGPGLQAPAGLGLLVVMGIHAFLVFGPYCRLLEGQADLFGCQATESVATFISALEKIAGVCGVDRRQRSWQHASIARRVDFLGKCHADPQRELRYQRMVRALNFLLLGAVGSPLAYRLLLG